MRSLNIHQPNVIPARAGIHGRQAAVVAASCWIPACAGMTVMGIPLYFPLQLEFDFLFAAFAFMFDAERRAARNINPFASDLYLERFSLLQTIGQAAQLVGKIADEIGFLDITF